MAAWRRHALELFPELREEIEGDDVFSPISLFFELLPFALDAHRRADDEALRRVYGFAQWCHHQRAGSDLPNAVGVAFYEHLFDEWELRDEVAPWLSPAVARDVWQLWEARLAPGELKTLRRLLPDLSPGAPWRKLHVRPPD